MPEHGSQADGLSESQATSRSTNVSDDKLTEVCLCHFKIGQLPKLDSNIFFIAKYEIKEL